MRISPQIIGRPTQLVYSGFLNIIEISVEMITGSFGNYSAGGSL